MVSIGILTLDFLLHGCQSLKEKRQRLTGLKDKFGRLPHVAVSEADHADVWQNAQYLFVVVGPKPLIEKTMQDILQHAQTLDAVICQQQREFL